MRASSEATVAGFLELARRIQERRGATGAQILEWAANYYHEIRVEDADLRAQGDMLLVQWGRTRPWLLTEPTDLRPDSVAAVASESAERRYLDVTRQLVPGGNDPDDEFDDVAVQLSLTLVYEAADGSEPNANRWIETPELLVPALDAVREDPFVASLLTRVPERLVATIDWAG